MSDESRQAKKELKTILLILIIFILVAAIIISAYSRVGIANALNMVFIQILSAGTGTSSSALGNIFYVVIIFLTLGATFYMFEKVIILLSEVKIGGILMRASMSSMKGHFIVCGGGMVGMHVAEKLKKEGKKVVIVENDHNIAENLAKRGYTVMEGDCMSEETLEKAKIRTASGIIACIGKDSINVFLVLTSKDLNPNIKIATRVNDLRSRNEFERAGADVIVTPDITGGYELADKIMSKN